MTSVQIVKFVDQDTDDEALAIVRVVGKSIVLGLSLKRNGDMQVVFEAQEADQIIDALQKARALAGQQKS